MGRHTAPRANPVTQDASLYRRILTGMLIFAGLATLIGLVVSWPSNKPINVSDQFQASFASSQEKIPAKVTKVDKGVCAATTPPATGAPPAPAGAPVPAAAPGAKPAAAPAVVPAVAPPAKPGQPPAPPAPAPAPPPAPAAAPAPAPAPAPPPAPAPAPKPAVAPPATAPAPPAAVPAAAATAPAAVPAAAPGAPAPNPTAPGSASTNKDGCRTATIKITRGKHKGLTSTLVQYGVAGEPALEKGDRIRVIEGPPTPATSGLSGQANQPTWSFVDYQRERPLIVWSAIVIIAILLLGALRGLRSLIGLVISIGVVSMYLLPALLRGGDPLTLAIVGSATIIFAVVFLVHGANWKSASAIGGTIVALLITALLAKLTISTTQLRGLGDEDNLRLVLFLPDVSVQGLMLCGFIIGAIGALNDVAIAQASTVNELARLEPGASRWRLFLSAMKVGQDHVASMVYTLVLTYVGAALPLLLLLSAAQRPFGETLTSDVLATELARSGVGALGLILAVPLTTLIAAWTVGPQPVHPTLRSEEYA